MAIGLGDVSGVRSLRTNPRLDSGDLKPTVGTVTVVDAEPLGTILTTVLVDTYDLRCRWW